MAVVVDMRTRYRYIFNRAAITPVDSCIYITGKGQDDGRIISKARIPGSNKGLGIVQPFSG